jgi:subtilisin family serine protease
MSALDLVNFKEVMEMTAGRAEVVIGLVDGPVAINHPDLVSDHIREIGKKSSSVCTEHASVACLHGTFIAGILSGKRGSAAPSICPGCMLLVRPIFSETTSGGEQIPSTTPQQLAAAIFECIDSGVHLINLSLALSYPSLRPELELEEALDHAASRGVIVVAAAGNQGTIGSSAITRHPWVIPVVAYGLRGLPMELSNLGNSIGRLGVGAQGDNITSLGTGGKTMTLGGTSVAAPFVTGAIALLWSLFPAATPAQMKSAVIRSDPRRRATVVPPLLDVEKAYQTLATLYNN